MPKSATKSPAAPDAPRKRSAHDRSAITESMEDYLECIFDLEHTKGYACVSDVAEALRLNRASTSIMVKRLGKLGFLRYEPYRGFALTPEGCRVAEKIRKRHAMLAELFQLMGLDHRDYLSDIEGLEHHLSDRAFRRFAELAAHLRSHPCLALPADFMSAKFVPLTEPLYDYLVTKRSNVEDPVLDALRIETETLGEISMMSISPEQGSLMTLLVGIIGAKWAVEVGTFTGTSSICIARGMVPGGKLTCFDQDFKWTTIARRYWAKAGVAERIELKLGAARELLTRWRPANQIDFVFIDADKEGYDSYYELLLPHVRPGGLILFDNMLRGGQVIDPSAKYTPANHAINLLNQKLADDKRIHSVLIPVADGLTLCRKW